MNEISQHFNNIANVYDSWKKKNWYYYQNLKKLVKEFIPEGKNVLEIGTGTGDILASLKPENGIGIDISEEMVKIAKKKYKNYPNLQFYNKNLRELEKIAFPDYILLVDVVEHLESIEKMTEDIKIIANNKTKIFISMANPLWEPILLLLEKLKLKMPEGKHYRVSTNKLLKIFYNNGFKLENHGFALLFPTYIPILSDIINYWFEKIHLVKKLGMIEYLILCKIKLL